MRVAVTSLAAIAALAVGTAAQAGSHAHMVEAYVDGAFDRTAPVWIAPVNTQQGADPTFKLMSAKLSDALTENGFTVVPWGVSKYAVTIDYAARNSGMAIQKTVTANDSAYRVAIVSEYDVSTPAKPKLVWQTVMDEYGISNDVRATIPSLIKASGRYFGVKKTSQSLMLATWCAENVPMLGSHIPAVCSRNPDRPYINLAGLLVGSSSRTDGGAEAAQPPGR